MIHITTILKHNVIGKLLNHLIVFFINVLIVRLLGATGSGTYFNELYILNFVVFIFSAGLDYASISLLAQEPAILPVLNRMLLKVTGLFVLLLTLYVFLATQLGSLPLQQPPVAIILFSTGNLLLIFFQGILSALKKFNLQNLLLGSSNLLFLCYLFFFMKPGNDSNFRMISITYAVLFLCQGLVMLYFSRAKVQLKKVNVSWATFIRPGITIMFSSLIYFAFLRVDNFFVEYYCSGKTLGNYVQCGKTGQYFLYFSSIISSTLLPFIANETTGASYSEWKRMMAPYILLLCLAAIAIAAGGKFVFPWIFGEDFTEMYPLMLILLPGFVCLGVLTLLNAVYIGKGNIKKIFLGDLFGLIMVLVLDLLFVPRNGAYAAAIISSVVYCLVFLFLFSGFKKQFDRPVRKTDLIRM